MSGTDRSNHEPDFNPVRGLLAVVAVTGGFWTGLAYLFGWAYLESSRHSLGVPSWFGEHDTLYAFIVGAPAVGSLFWLASIVTFLTGLVFYAISWAIDHFKLQYRQGLLFLNGVNLNALRIAAVRITLSAALVAVTILAVGGFGLKVVGLFSDITPTPVSEASIESVTIVTRERIPFLEEFRVAGTGHGLTSFEYAGLYEFSLQKAEDAHLFFSVIDPVSCQPATYYLVGKDTIVAMKYDLATAEGWHLECAPVNVSTPIGEE